LVATYRRSDLQGKEIAMQLTDIHVGDWYFYNGAPVQCVGTRVQTRIGPDHEETFVLIQLPNGTRTEVQPQELQEVRRTPAGMDPRHLVYIKGKPFVKFAGILELVHKRGPQSRREMKDV
jgi:hypothetical protein